MFNVWPTMHHHVNQYFSKNWDTHNKNVVNKCTCSTFHKKKTFSPFGAEKNPFHIAGTSSCSVSSAYSPANFLALSLVSVGKWVLEARSFKWSFTSSNPNCFRNVLPFWMIGCWELRTIAAFILATFNRP